MSPHENQIIPDESQLIHQFARGNGSVFVGAGLSIGAGLPGWADLVKPLAQQVNSPEHSSFPDIAQYLVNLHDRPALVEHVWRLLKQATGPTQIHKQTISLPVPRIFTTNLDRLLEAAFEEQRLPFCKVVTDEHIALMDSAAKSIVKLHGDLEQPESWVITSADYENYFSNHPGIANLLGMDLHSRTVLFLGYSFSDIDLRMILSQVKKVAGSFRRNLFAVQLNPSLLEIEELRRRGVRVIGLKAGEEDFNAVLLKWLQEFSRRVRESLELQPSARQLFAIDFINGSVPKRSVDLLGRTTDLARVMDGLRSRYPLVAIKGPAGVGKTTLAIEVGHTCSLSRIEAAADDVIFEYIVWISAKDKPDQRRWLDDILNAIAETTNNLAITQLPFKTSLQRADKQKQVSHLLRSYSTLVIIDNFETIIDRDLIAWLEQIPDPSKALITSRSKPERVAAWSVDLEGLAKEEALQLLRQHTRQAKLSLEPDDESLHDLARVTGGNPQAIKMSIGLAQGGITDLSQIVSQLDNPDKKPERIFKELLSGSWERLSEPARHILLVTPIFIGASSIRKEALRAASGVKGDFDHWLVQCLSFGLLEEGHEQQRYIIHPITRAFARAQLNEHPQWEREAKDRCTKYFLEFVKSRVIRPRPEPSYWNALVSVSMSDLDLEWPSIQQVLTWADEMGQDEILTEFVMLLVHYMDSRFLNLERLEYVEKAVSAFDRMGRKEEEALLRIDALGWTYVEVLKLDQAYQQIFKGFEVAQGDDLRALGLAWRARVRVERRDFKRADELINEAFAINCSPWIKFRVNMAAGDIELKRGGVRGPQKALRFYQSAAKEADSYGGEGYGYQIGPRIGLAYLGIGQIEEAEQKFEELKGLEQIPIGKLYAEYGLALVASERGNVPEARVMLNDVKAKLSRRTRSNLLLRLIEEQEARLQSAIPPRKGAKEVARRESGHT